MSAQRFRVCYEIITEESARDGEAAERGFILSGGHHVDIDTAIADETGDYSLSLRQALNYCHPQENAGNWFTEVDGRPSYQTGDEETRSLHPPDGITGASYNRLARLLGLRVKG